MTRFESLYNDVRNIFEQLVVRRPDTRDDLDAAFRWLNEKYSMSPERPKETREEIREELVLKSINESRFIYYGDIGTLAVRREELFLKWQGSILTEHFDRANLSAESHEYFLMQQAKLVEIQTSWT